MKILNKIMAGTLLTGACITNTSCEMNKYEETEVIERQIEKQMADRPYSDFKRATADWRKGIMGTADAQSTLDSVGYRKVFDATIAAQDSEKVAEFNRIAASKRVPAGLTKYDAEQALLDGMKDSPTKDALKLKRESSMVFTYNLPAKQHIADSTAYNDFFNKHNLLNDRAKAILNKIEKEIKPVYQGYKHGSAIKF